MRLVNFLRPGADPSTARVGVLTNGDRVIDIGQPDIRTLLSAGRVALSRAREIGAAASASGIPLSELRLLAPLPRPERLICAWVNYPHPGTPQLKQPIFFTKFGSAVIGPGDAIKIPAGVTRSIVEAELAVIIGTAGKNIRPEDAMAHVAGYTIVNDVTALDFKLEEMLGVSGPYMMGKCIDTFAPMGPVLVTSDEIADPHRLRVRYWVNDSLVLDGDTSRMTFDIPTMISYLSRFFALQPGDILSTGSPVNGLPGAAPRPYLAPGDHVRIEIEGVGVLENAVTAADGVRQD